MFGHTTLKRIYESVCKLILNLEMCIEKGRGIQWNVINKPTELLQVNPMGDVLEGPNRAFSSSFLYFWLIFVT